MVYCPNCGVANQRSNPLCKNCRYVLYHTQSNWIEIDCGRCHGIGCEACNHGKILTWERPLVCSDCSGTGSGRYGATTLHKKCNGTGYSNGVKKSNKIAGW